MNTLSRLGGALALTAGAALTLGSGVASAQAVNFQGNTDGCFGMSCLPVSGTTDLGGLTYRDSTFNVTSSPRGFVSIGNRPADPNVDNLGSFTLAGSLFDFNARTFELTVNFTVPSSTSPNSTVIRSSLSGDAVSSDNGGVFINFDNNPRSFNFGSGANAGTFTFFVNDLSLVAGGTVAVTGVIQTQVSAIPEPETYALMMAGLAAVGFMSRRRKKA